MKKEGFLEIDPNFLDYFDVKFKDSYIKDWLKMQKKEILNDHKVYDEMHKIDGIKTKSEFKL